MIYFLVANKADEKNNRQISEEEAKMKAELYGYLYCEVSAKTGEGLEELFKNQLIKAIERKYPVEVGLMGDSEEIHEVDNRVDLTQKIEQRTSACC